MIIKGDQIYTNIEPLDIVNIGRDNPLYIVQSQWEFERTLEAAQEAYGYVKVGDDSFNIVGLESYCLAGPVRFSEKIGLVLEVRR